MPKILGYSQYWDKLKTHFPPLPKTVLDIVGNVHHTTIRLDKRNGYYHAGKWQEVFKPRSKQRVVVRPEVEVQKPLSFFLYQIEELAGGDLVRYDAMENGIKMEPWVYRALIESMYRESEYWRGDYTRMLVLPIVIPEQPKISVAETVKSGLIENLIRERKSEPIKVEV